MIYRISNTDRKATAQKIAELYEVRVQYAGMPTANYQLIDKNGETALILKRIAQLKLQIQNSLTWLRKMV